MPVVVPCPLMARGRGAPTTSILLNMNGASAASCVGRPIPTRSQTGRRSRTPSRSTSRPGPRPSLSALADAFPDEGDLVGGPAPARCRRLERNMLPRRLLEVVESSSGSTPFRGDRVGETAVLVRADSRSGKSSPASSYSMAMRTEFGISSFGDVGQGAQGIGCRQGAQPRRGGGTTSPKWPERARRLTYASCGETAPSPGSWVGSAMETRLAIGHRHQGRRRRAVLHASPGASLGMRERTGERIRELSRHGVHRDDHAELVVRRARHGQPASPPGRTHTITPASRSVRPSAPRRWGRSCTAETTTEPSPTADATRFTDPRRTSPTANTPCTEVSRGCGGSSYGHARRPPSATTSSPVSTYPHRSRRTIVRQPVGPGGRADEHEDGVGRLLRDLPRGEVAYLDVLEVTLARLPRRSPPAGAPPRLPRTGCR